MIRARESLDRWARAAHDVLDEAQAGQFVKAEYVNWALSYLGDKAGSCKVPPELRIGYDADLAAYESTVKAMHL